MSFNVLWEEDEKAVLVFWIIMIVYLIIRKGKSVLM